jgi:hypothetical protein
VTDIDLIEEHPASYVIDISRRHRWIRGDWQLAGWLLPSVPGPSEGDGAKPKRQQNQLTALLVWKIFDNLRRSLVPPSLLTLLLGGWLLGLGPVWVWTLLVTSAVLAPSLLTALIEFVRRPEARSWLTHWVLTSRSAVRPLLLSMLSLALLPYDAWISLDAILRSGVRMLFTRRGLLLWHLGSYAKRNARHTLADFFMEMWVAPTLALLVGLVLFFISKDNQTIELLFCAPILLMWLLSPLVGWWISVPLGRQPPDLNATQLAFLRRSARRTWRYFSQFVSAQDSWLLDEAVHFLEGRELKPEEEAYYDQPQRSTEVATLYEHGKRAIQYGLRFGAHQLPLIGCGDWNDGMNLIGRDGKGESVWLAWFLYENLQLFSALARRRGDAEFADNCTAQAVGLRGNIEANAWDGAWYRRAYFDDGTPLGSSENAECKIDSISQSWAVISGAGNPERARLAMQNVDKYLVQRDAQLVQLLTPPFDKSKLEPGYIKGYVPGVRENGGQYTHAAIWASMAFAMLGDKARAWELFAMLNPINHGSSAEAISRYKVEPYVMAADIYVAEPHTGRGGWTWYTGASGWMYRLSMETLLGVQLEADQLRITPCVPAHWNSYKIHYRYRETLYHITMQRLAENADSDVTQQQNTILLLNDQAVHHVVVYFK